MNPKLITLIAALALTVIFIAQNTAVVELRFLFWKLNMSRALMFPLLVLIGIGTGWFLRGLFLHKSDGQNS